MVIVSHLADIKKNEVSLLDIFIAADEIELFEISQRVEKWLLETETAWKFPNDFLTICKHDTFTNLYEVALELVSDPKPKHNDLSKREPAYPFDSKIINAKDAALIASWIDKKQGIPYRFKDIPFKFELIYRASLENFKWYKLYIEKNNSDTFGNYNNYMFKSTTKSFIFSLLSSTTGAIPKLSRVTSKKEAITWCMAKGPCFGYRDLWIEYDISQRSAIGYPEIRTAEYRICRDAPTSAPSCSSLEYRWNALSPTQCVTNLTTNNYQNISDYCPTDGSQATCDNGYYCCSEECTNSSCRCKIGTDNHSCKVKCPECYTMELMMQYPNSRDEIVTSNISMDFDQDLIEAQKFQSENPVESKVRCFYNPGKPLQVLLSIDYSVQTWILVGISYIFWITEIWNKLHILFTRLFYNISKQEKKSPINITNRNENPIMNDNALLIYEEAIAKQ
ncbi:45067_t:CDS:2 [Gigaspora margarita]|uniref:45067_t:CDS:1 n=1 Tax=Gigaspora margarita TaxID=4874 RepID=A0ABM8W6M3_GIGMA|nr:45067_t:CDS:2 [Gigaspora margarita]